MSERIRIRRDDEAGDDRNYDMVFPMLVLSLRDFTLSPQSNGQATCMTADQYLENCLALKQGTGPKIGSYNRRRRHIRKCFRRRHCFTFDRPAPKEMLKSHASLPDSGSAGLLPQFVADMEKFVKFIYENAPAKQLLNRQVINGRSE